VVNSRSFPRLLGLCWAYFYLICIVLATMLCFVAIVHNFLRQCKSVAWRAGLNCGLCDTGQGHCAKGAHCHNWFLHKFRATFATMHLRAGVDLRTVQNWMGHKDLESTMRYLKPARDKEALRKVNATFPLPMPTSGSDDAHA